MGGGLGGPEASGLCVREAIPVTLSHREHIFTMCFSQTSTMLAAYGFISTKVWNINTGRLLHHVKNSVDSPALCLTFSEMILYF